MLTKKILKTMIEMYNGGPVGLGTLAVNISEERETLEDMYEPYLIQSGFLVRTRQGRCATAKAYEHFGYSYDKERVSLTFNLIPLEEFEKLDIPSFNILDVHPRE
jgi:Holliday junction resolvasome RuvABC ATP-dependent DNA helicase subunit